MLDEHLVGLGLDDENLARELVGARLRFPLAPGNTHHQSHNHESPRNHQLPNLKSEIFNLQFEIIVST